MESPPPWAMFTTDDVTKKVAYAYAKQSVFAWLGVFGVVGGAALVGWSAWSHSLSIAGLLLLIGGLGVLAAIFTSKDLKKVNHLALRVNLGVGGALLILVIVAHFVSFESTLQQDVEAAGVLVSLLPTLSYPLPIKRADSALYNPTQVKELADRRTAGFTAGVVAALAAVQLIADHLTGALSNLDLLPPGVILVVGIIGVILFLGRLTSEKLWLPSAGILAVALVVGALTIVSGPAFSMAVGLWIASAAASGLAVLTVLSPRLNTGRTIVGHRA